MNGNVLLFLFVPHCLSLTNLSFFLSTNMVYPYLMKFELLREVEEASLCVQQLALAQDDAAKDALVCTLLGTWTGRNATQHESFEVVEPLVNLRLVVVEEVRKMASGTQMRVWERTKWAE